MGGVFWIPLRMLEDGQLPGTWAAFGFFISATALLAPLAAVRRHFLRRAGPGLVITGLLVGGGPVLFVNSLVLTDVVRALLLFYLTPVWSTILARLVPREAITRWRVIAILLGLAGLLILLDVEQGAPLPRNLGDWIALAGGFTWACASVRLRARPQVHSLESLFACFACGTAVALILALLPFAPLAPLPPWDIIERSAPWVVLIGAGFLVPANFLIVWGARLLSPGRVGLLLLCELIVGAVSAAILADEAFGVREVIGVVFIGGASLVEIARRQPSVKPFPASP